MMPNKRKIKKVVSAAIQLKKKRGKWYEKWKKRITPWLEQIKKREGPLYEIWKENRARGMLLRAEEELKSFNKGRE
jgi:hypothetical protein